MAGDNLPEIRNKIKRQNAYRTAKIEKTKAKLVKRKERAQAEKLDPTLKAACFFPSPRFLHARND